MVFVRVGCDGDNDPVKNPQRAFDEIDMAIGDRIEGARIDGNIVANHRTYPQSAGSDVDVCLKNDSRVSPYRR